MGEVYRARDTRLDRTVAIKVLPAQVAGDSDRRARFEREAKLLAALNHPGIAHLYGFETTAVDDDGRVVNFLAMELVEGEDLAARLARGSLPLDEALDVARQVAEALEEAHERGIVHRDLKPANIKLTPAGQVKVLDFGLAKAWSGDAAGGAPGVDPSQSPTVVDMGTTAGVILGTAAYMSPEQARGRPADKRADIWAFGVLLFETLAGKRPFQGETVSDTLAAVLRQDVPWSLLPAETPPAVRQLLRRCLDRDPRQRLRDIGEARVSLTAGSSPEAATPAASPRPGRLVRLAPWLLTAAAVLAATWATWMGRDRGLAAPQVQQFDVAFPGDIEPVPNYDDGFALSPDGQLVAMVGVKNGRRSLFVRRIDSADVLEIAEFGGVNGATFSPDSTKVALLSTDNRVAFISLVDRQRAVVTSNADLVGGIAWGRSGIVFARDGALWIAPTGGGEARALTTLDAARREVLHAAPFFLSSGRTVLFSSLTAEPGTERIEAVSVDDGSRRVIVERGTTPVWSPTGHLLFARDGAVLATEFDEQSLQARGTATPVLAPGLVGTFLRGALALRLAGNGTLLFIPRDFHFHRLVSVARDGAALPLEFPRGNYLNPRLSPDGFRVMVESEFTHLEVLNQERGTRALATAAAAGTAFSVWNRDGSRIVYRRLPVPFWASADGSGQQGEVTGAVANDSPTAPGPDPDSVLVNRAQAETSSDVFLLSLKGAFEPRPLVSTRAFEGGAELSPDGRWLAFASNESGRFEIYVRRFPELDRQWQVSEGGGTQLRWSAAGREIYYRGDLNMMAVAFDGTAREPVMGKPRALFRDEYELGLGVTIANYDVTPDGRFLMLRRDPQAGHLRIVLNWTEELKRVLAKAGGP